MTPRLLSHKTESRSGISHNTERRSLSMAKSAALYHAQNGVSSLFCWFIKMNGGS